MRNKSKKIIIIGIITHLCINLYFIPCVSSEKNNSNVETFTVDSEQQFEINIFGSIRVRNIDTPWNQTAGIYAEITNLGPDIGYVNIGYELKTISTVPSSYREILIENYEAPVGESACIGIFGGNFGFGVITFTVFIDGYGEDEGYHYEKTGYGICYGFFVFVLFQH